MALVDRSQPLAELTQQVKGLAARPSSPEIVAALLQLLEDPPYTGRQSKTLWLAVVQQLGGLHASPQSVAPLGRLAADYRKVFGPTVMGAWLEDHLRYLSRQLAERFPDAPRAEPIEPPAAPPPPRGSISDLYAAVAAQPDDDEVRLVLADALMEQGDPRGELIALQMRRHRGETLAKAEQQRERDLVRRHEKEWLGPVAGVTNQPSRVWRRGFLEKCAFLPRGKLLDAARGHPAWATVRELQLRLFDREKGLDVLLHPVLRGIRALDNPSHEVARAIATSDPPWRIERLRGWLIEQQRLLPELLQARGLPSLRALDLTSHFGAQDDPALLRELWPSPLGRQLQRLSFGVYDDFFQAWTAELMAQRQITVRVRARVDFVFEGDRLALRPPAEPRLAGGDVGALLERLPRGAFSTVEIDPALGDEEASLAEIARRLVKR